jgi:hypothetical protein
MSFSILSNRAKMLVFVSVLLFYVLLFYSGFNYLLLMKTRHYAKEVNQVLVQISYPEIAFYDEALNIDVTVENQSGAVVGPVQVNLYYLSPTMVVVEEMQTTRIDFGELAVGEHKSGRVVLNIQTEDDHVKKEAFQLKTSLLVYRQGVIQAIETNVILVDIMPLQSVRTIAKASGSLLLGWAIWLGKQWWEFGAKRDENDNDEGGEA